VKQSGNWLAAALLINLLLGIVIVGMLVTKGEPFHKGLKTTTQTQIVHLRQSGSVDSWGPMHQAYWRKVESPASNLYGCPISPCRVRGHPDQLVRYPGTCFPALGPKPSVEADSFELMIALAAAPIASRVDWEHHYGVFLPIFAVAMPGLMHFRPLGRATAPLFAVGFVAIAGVMLRPDLIFRNRWVGLAGSHLLFGGLVLFGLLLALRVEYSRMDSLCL